MIGDLFDSPWKVLIVAIVLIVLFGSKKLPDAARSLGRSMRILKSEVSNLGDEEHETHAASASSPVPAPAPQLTSAPAAAPFPAATPAADHQGQIDALQQQIRDLQRAATMDPAPAATAPEPQRTQSS
jgi:sec-independent protein translocase protein TatA